MAGQLPDYVVACVGGGSNAIGMFHPFLQDVEDGKVKLVGVEAGGEGMTALNSATLTMGTPGVLHGTRTYLLQVIPATSRVASWHHGTVAISTTLVVILFAWRDSIRVYSNRFNLWYCCSFSTSWSMLSCLVRQDSEGQIPETHSISAGLDYPGVGPEHSWLKDSGRAEYTAVTDEQALEGLQTLARTEGLIPALEPSHAVYHAMQVCYPRAPARFFRCIFLPD